MLHLNPRSRAKQYQSPVASAHCSFFLLAPCSLRVILNTSGGDEESEQEGNAGGHGDDARLRNGRAPMPRYSTTIITTTTINTSITTTTTVKIYTTIITINTTRYCDY